MRLFWIGWSLWVHGDCEVQGKGPEAGAVADFGDSRHESAVGALDDLVQQRLKLRGYVCGIHERRRMPLIKQATRPRHVCRADS